MSEDTKEEVKQEPVKDVIDGKGNPEMADKQEIAKEEIVNPLDAMHQKQLEVEKKMTELFEALTAAGYDGHGYAKGSVVQVPGPLFASLSNYHAQLAGNMAAIQRAIVPVNHICEGTITGASEIQLELMKIHEANCNAGLTASPEQLEEERAEREIQVTEEGTKEDTARGVDEDAFDMES